jgi:hypothetical protein
MKLSPSASGIQPSGGTLYGECCGWGEDGLASRVSMGVEELLGKVEVEAFWGVPAGGANG